MIAAVFSVLGDVLSSKGMYEATMRFAIVLAFAAVGEWVAEKAGTLNISIEAMMIAGAYTSAVAWDRIDNVPFALALGIVAGVVIALILAGLYCGLRSRTSRRSRSPR